jgi:hypothetical protein
MQGKGGSLHQGFGSGEEGHVGAFGGRVDHHNSLDVSCWSPYPKPTAGNPDADP